MRLEGQVAIVTGGASGLGAATARRLAAGGARPAIFDLDSDAGQALAAELGGVFCAVDVSDAASLEHGLAASASALGPARILVHCAGTGGKPFRLHGRHGPYPLEEFERVVRINLIGAFNAARLAAGPMAAQPPLARGERGVILLVSSINAQDAPVGNAAYVASKGGVEAMTLTLARDLGPVGIRVVTLAPGSFDTPMFRQIPDEYVPELLKLAPFPSDAVGDPDDFAALACHVCENPMINGEVIRIDAGARHSHTR